MSWITFRPERIDIERGPGRGIEIESSFVVVGRNRLEPGIRPEGRGQRARRARARARQLEGRRGAESALISDVPLQILREAVRRAQLGGEPVVRVGPVVCGGEIINVRDVNVVVPHASGHVHSRRHGHDGLDIGSEILLPDVGESRDRVRLAAAHVEEAKVHVVALDLEARRQPDGHCPDQKWPRPLRRDTARYVADEPIGVGRRHVRIVLLVGVPTEEERRTQDPASNRIIAAQIECGRLGREEVARRVVDLWIDREVALGKRPGLVQAIVPVQDAECDIAAVVRGPPLMPDRREEVPRVGRCASAPSRLIHPGRSEKPIHPIRFAPCRDRGDLLAEGPGPELDQCFRRRLAATRRQEDRAPERVPSEQHVRPANEGSLIDGRHRQQIEVDFLCVGLVDAHPVEEDADALGRPDDRRYGEPPDFELGLQGAPLVVVEIDARQIGEPLNDGVRPRNRAG